MTRALGEDVHFRVLRLLEEKPDLSQREIAGELGVSLGAINYCLRALIDKGQLKARNFRNSKNKVQYIYVLTPAGVAKRAALTKSFLERKMAEFHALKAEIEALGGDLEAGEDPSNG